LAEASEGEEVVMGVAVAEATAGMDVPSRSVLSEPALVAVALEACSDLDADRPRSQTKSATWDPSRTMTTELITI
jgi:hypothetical protein